MEYNHKSELRKITFSDLFFIIWSGLSYELAGIQYPKNEYLKQFLIAPLRFFRCATRSKSFIIWLNGSRVGYIGLNPLSSNIEYYLLPKARGGVGYFVIAEYIRAISPLVINKSAYMLPHNERSVRAFQKALDELRFEANNQYTKEVLIGGKIKFTIQAGKTLPVSSPV